MCMELMLIIEVDGITHHWEETIVKDKKKQDDLEAAGFTVLRFKDEEVLNDLNAVHAFLENWIEKKICGESKWRSKKSIHSLNNSILPFDEV